MTTNPQIANTAYPMQVPCGKCTRCRLEKSRQWAIRCVHEAMITPKSCFITLTYNNEHVPKSGSLVKRHFQLFIKKLREEIRREEIKNKVPKEKRRSIRYFQCGEYGDSLKRPHYHAIIFGEDFSHDRRLWKSSKRGDLYRSRTLEKHWPYGYSSIGAVTFESAAYVARYVLKKRYGDQAVNHYTKFNESTGEIISEKLPEYTTMSRRPGIGAPFFEKYRNQIARTGEVVSRGRKVKAPRFYDTKIEKMDPQAYKRIKTVRTKGAIAQKLDNTPERLEVKENVAKLQNRATPRSYENVKNIRRPR